MSLRRIVIGLAPGTPQRELEAASDFAGRLDAELLGLFVEDAQLLRFAALPFAHEISLPTAQRRGIDPATLERELRSHAEEARRSLASAAGRASTRWAFQVARGDPGEEIVAAAAAALQDATARLRLLMLGDGGSPMRRWMEDAARPRPGNPTAPELVAAQGIPQLAELLGSGESGILILRAEPEELSQQDLLALLRRTPVPIAVITRDLARRRRL